MQTSRLNPADLAAVKAVYLHLTDLGSTEARHLLHGLLAGSTPAGYLAQAWDRYATASAYRSIVQASPTRYTLAQVNNAIDAEARTLADAQATEAVPFASQEA